VLQQYVANEGDAWTYTLDQIHQYFERALVRHEKPAEVPVPAQPLVELVDAEPPPLLLELLAGTIESVRLLGRRTGELHQALASDLEDPAFAPEPFGSLYQRSLYQSVRNLAGRVLLNLRDHLSSLPEAARGEAQAVLALESDVLRACHGIVGRSIGGQRIRCHGDFHLGQVLHTGSDFVIIDFEGEPARSLAERRLKRSPLRDVAGMLRSFDYAVNGALFADTHGRGVLRAEDVALLEPWARFWREWVSSSFLRSYLAQLDGSALLPPRREDLGLLLRVLLLEKALYELGYELDNRPDWVRLPLRGILSLLGAGA
jgi:maltose alpha-D-glucosyltransferase/alpha-amylase